MPDGKDQRKNPHEATFLKLDSSKARGQIGWHPRWNLESSLKAVNDWYRSYGKNEDMRGKTINQIRSYQLEKFQSCTQCDTLKQ